MKRKTKILISALSVMFVAAIAVAIASFSFAGDGDTDDLLEDSELVAAAEDVSEKTIIDYIIENSNSTDTEVDSVYHIVEIASSGTASTLGTYASGDESDFKKYVIDGNKTIEALMAAGKVEYKNISPSTTSEDDLKAVSNADLIYLSNDSANKFSKSNDLSEDLYDILHQYAVGDFKPLIIDSPNTSSIDTDDSKTMAQLASNVFGPNEMYYYTFKWSSGASATDYLGHANGSLYLGINGKTQQSNGVWTTVYAQSPTLNEDGTVTPAEGDTAATMAKILTISTDGTKSRTESLLEGNTLYDLDASALYTVTNTDGTDAVTKLASENGKYIYTLSEQSILYKSGYNNRTGVRPTYIENDVTTLSDLESSDINFDDYDMIVIEDNCNSETISNALYKKFASAMYAKLHIVYGAGMGTATTTTTTVSDKRETNYSELFFLVATESSSGYIANYDNIYITSRADFSAITTSTSASTAKVIADLINASKYRGIGGNSSSSSMFTVLEIQPCYPIDEEVAEENKTVRNQSTQCKIYGNRGAYYTSPSEVVDGKTKEQVPEGTDYYQWELSKAKLADALGLSYDKINLVQMSTEEFAADKTEILGTYDMIYIGGNTSALVEATDYKFLCSQYLGQNYQVNNHAVTVSDLAEFPIYTMYSHNGELVASKAPAHHKFNGSKLASQVYKNGNAQTTLTYLNGNDITYNRYQALQEYIDAGMPVVVSKKLTTAFNLAESLDNKYLQNSLDPDSNMYKVLLACKTKYNAEKTASANETVLWDFDQDAVASILSDGTLGDTLTGYVSVFASTSDYSGTVTEEKVTITEDGNEVTYNAGDTIVGSREDLLKVYQASKKRPKLVVKSMPATYNRFDSSTLLTNRTLTFKYDVVNSSDYTVTLYYDEDGNSKFDRSAGGKEVLTSSSTGTLSYQCPDSFSGPIYWMLEAKDNDTGITVSQTGFFYVKSTDNKKQTVSVLQIMPDGGEGRTGNDSLYFCTECQRSSYILNYNPLATTNDKFARLYQQGFADQSSKSGNLGTNSANGLEMYIGKHKHTFGICSYDSNLKVSSYQGADDFYTNLADEISDLYDFNVDVIQVSDLEKLEQQITDAYTYSVDDQGNISSTKLSYSDKWSAIKEGVESNADSYDDYQTVLNSFVETMLKKDTSLKEDTAKATLLSSSYTYENLSAKLGTDTETQVDALYIMKKKCDYEVLAAEYYADYVNAKEDTEEKEEELNKVLDAMIAKAKEYAATNTIPSGVQIDESASAWVEDLENIKSSGFYSDYYSLGNNYTMSKDISAPYLAGSAYDGQHIETYLSDFYHTQDTELEYEELYEFYTRISAGAGTSEDKNSNWLEKLYSTIVFGPSESFNNDDIDSDALLDDLEKYVADDHQVVLYHETLSPFTDGGAVKLTARLRSYFGMDRYHMQTDTELASSVKKSTSNPIISDSDTYDVHYTSTNSDKYFMTKLNGSGGSDIPNYLSYTQYDHYDQATGQNVYKVTGYKGYLTDVAYTDYFSLADNSDQEYAVPYKYVYVSSAANETTIQDTQFTRQNFEGKYATNRASQNNEGFVTTYPFTIASELYIGPTHTCSYALDLEDDDMTVWYSLAAGDTSHDSGSLYAATPRDGMDNYFLYSYGSVFYCGAGHSDITGIGKDNNDERYLFINILCNSVRESLNQPSIKVFDYDDTETKTTNNTVKKTDNGYEMKVAEDETYPQFNLKITTDTEATIATVKIFYDLDYKDGNTDDAYTADANHILIANWTSKNISVDQNKHLFRYDSSLEKLYGSDGHQIEETYTDASGKEISAAATTLKLQSSYFDPYNGEYTYIVIEVTDSKGQKTYQRIKVKATPHLFDLT